MRSALICLEREHARNGLALPGDLFPAHRLHAARLAVHVWRKATVETVFEVVDFRRFHLQGLHAPAAGARMGPNNVSLHDNRLSA